MSIKDRSTRIAAGGAAALGLTLGVAGLAGAATSPDQTASPAPAVEEDQTQDPILNGSIQSPEDESLSEADEAKALEGLATIAASDAEQAALAANPGATVNSSELGNENGSVVYEVDLTDASGADVEVKVDAGNGDILSQENDDHGNEADEGDEGSASGADEANEAAEVTPNG